MGHGRTIAMGVVGTGLMAGGLLQSQNHLFGMATVAVAAGFAVLALALLELVEDCPASEWSGDGATWAVLRTLAVVIGGALLTGIGLVVSERVDLGEVEYGIVVGLFSVHLALFGFILWVLIAASRGARPSSTAAADSKGSADHKPRRRRPKASSVRRFDD